MLKPKNEGGNENAKKKQGKTKHSAMIIPMPIWNRVAESAKSARRLGRKARIETKCIQKNENSPNSLNE